MCFRVAGSISSVRHRSSLVHALMVMDGLVDLLTSEGSSERDKSVRNHQCCESQVVSITWNPIKQNSGKFLAR